MFGSSELSHKEGYLSKGLEFVLQLRTASTDLINTEKCCRTGDSRDLNFPTP